MTAVVLGATRRTFSSLRKHRNYRLFFTGQAVSVTGTWMQNVAAAWLILELTGSPVAVGALFLCQFLPFTLFSLFAGVLVDRVDPRRLVIAAQASSMIFAAALATLTFAGVIAAWEVYLLTALRGVALVVDAPARQALTFQMVGPRELPNAVALNSSLFNGARIVGPAIGGLVVATAGTAFCFALNAVTFLAVLAGLFRMRERELVRVERADEPPTVVAGAREALAYVRETPVARVVLATVLVVSMLAFNFNVLLPVLAKETLARGAETFGIISAFFGAGALVGALVSASLRRARLKTLLVGTGGSGIAQLLLAPQSSLLAVALLLFATGLCFTLWTSNANSTLQLAAPDHLRGRVIALYYFAFNGSAPFGGLLAGWLAAAGGTALAFSVGGAAAVMMTAAAFVMLRSAVPAAGRGGTAVDERPLPKAA